MILKILICLNLLITGVAFGDEERIRLCEKEGENFGNGLGRDKIPAECFDLFQKAAALTAVKTSANGEVLAFGYKNIIFLKLSGKTRVITGSYTELEEIRALAIDEAHQEIAVLNGKGDVLFFSSYITGNVAPLRILKHKDLTGATDLVINGRKNEVVILNKNSRSLLFFSRLANTQAPEKLKKLSVLKVIKNLVGQESVTLDEEHQEIFMLDNLKKKIHVYSWEARNAKPIRSLESPVVVKNAVKVEYSSLKDEINVSNQESIKASVPRTSLIK